MDTGQTPPDQVLECWPTWSQITQAIYQKYLHTLKYSQINITHTSLDINSIFIGTQQPSIVETTPHFAILLCV